MKIVTNDKKLKMVSRSMNEEQIKMHHGLLQDIIKKYDGKLQGCSCVQYGHPLRGFTMRHPKTKVFSYVFNPTVIWTLGKRRSLEGCLSVQGYYFVKRPYFLKAEWEDEEGNKVSKILGPKRARIFMHEMDHLDGITIKTKGYGGFKC